MNFTKFLSIVFLGAVLAGCSGLQEWGNDNASASAPTQNNESAVAAPDETADDNNGGSNGDLIEGVAGNYLAGRAALENADFAKSAEFLRKTLDKDPNNASLLERTAVLYILSGDVADAVPLAKKWVENKPLSLVPNLTLLLNAVKNNQWDEARYYADIIESSKANKLASGLIKAWLYTESGDYQAAQDLLKPLLSDPAAAGVVLMHSALMAEFRRDDMAALSYYATAMTRYQTVPLRLAMNAGHVFERLAEPQKAAELYQAFVQKGQTNYVFDAAMARLAKGEVAPANIRTTADGFANILFDIANFFESQNSHESALVYAQLARFLAPDFEYNRLLLSELLESFEQFDAAAKINQSLLDHPSFGWAAGLRLAREYEKMNQPKKSMSLLNKMRDQYPNRTEAATMLGDLYRNAKDYAAAIEAYSQAIDHSEKNDDNLWALYYARGTAFERAQLWSSAEADLKKSLELSPDQPYVLNYLAYSWVDRGINYSEAEEMLVRAVKLAPQDAFIIDSLGWLYFKVARYEEAEQLLQTAVEIRPFDPQLIDHYGDVLWKLNRREQAVVQWKRALSFGPEEDLKKSLAQKIKNGLDAGAPNKSAPADKTASSKS